MSLIVENYIAANFDVAVVGAGPAGAVCARSLASKGWKVLMLNKPASAWGFGETLPPECNPIFEQLGLMDALQRSEPLESPGIVSCWGAVKAQEQDFLGNPYGTGWHLDRERFDHELRREAFNAGVEFASCARPAPFSFREGWWQCERFRARYLIDAAGRNGVRAATPAERQIEDTLLALVLRVSYSRGRSPDLRMHLESVPDGWWYWSPVPNGKSICTFFTNRLGYVRLRRASAPEYASDASLIRELLRGGEIERPRWTSVTSSIRRHLSGENWIAAGDSASCYDPLSGQGILKAVRHADAAAHAVDEGLRGVENWAADYERQVRREFLAYSEQRKSYYAAEWRWPSGQFWSEPRG